MPKVNTVGNIKLGEFKKVLTKEGKKEKPVRIAKGFQIDVDKAKRLDRLVYDSKYTGLPLNGSDLINEAVELVLEKYENN